MRNLSLPQTAFEGGFIHLTSDPNNEDMSPAVASILLDKDILVTCGLPATDSPPGRAPLRGRPPAPGSRSAPAPGSRSAPPWSSLVPMTDTHTHTHTQKVEETQEDVFPTAVM